jgi:hypothetical protein
MTVRPKHGTLYDGTAALNSYDPLSLHRYTYCQNNVVNRVDPSGHTDFISTLATIGIGATIGGLSAGAIAEAQGRVVTVREVIWGASFGAVLGPLAAWSAPVAVGLGVGGFVYSGLSFGPILFDKNATPEQRRASAVLIATSMYGAYAGMKVGGASGRVFTTAPTDPPPGDYVILRHGTTLARALSIIKNGPDENFVEPGDTAPARGISFVEEGYTGADVGAPEDYAAGKALAFPDEGGPAILRIAVPKKIANLARESGGLFRFEPETGLAQLKAAWNSDVWKWAPPAPKR